MIPISVLLLWNLYLYSAISDPALIPISLILLWSLYLYFFSVSPLIPISVLLLWYLYFYSAISDPPLIPISVLLLWYLYLYSSISYPTLIPISLLLRYTPRSWSTEYINWSPLSYIGLLVTLGLYYLPIILDSIPGLIIVLDSVPGPFLFQDTFFRNNPVSVSSCFLCFRSFLEYDNDKTDFYLYLLILY